MDVSPLRRALTLGAALITTRPVIVFWAVLNDDIKAFVGLLNRSKAVFM